MVYEDKIFSDLKLVDEVIKGLQFKDCKFLNCVFEDVNIEKSSFLYCVFENCFIVNPKAKMKTEIQGVEVVNCRLMGINWREFIYRESFLDPISTIKNSSLKYNTFFGMNLKKINFTDNEIINSLFNECNLEECKFIRCNLEETEFINGDLIKADFTNATGYKIDINSCKIKGAKFSFPEVVRLLDVLEIEVGY